MGVQVGRRNRRDCCTGRFDNASRRFRKALVHRIRLPGSNAIPDVKLIFRSLFDLIRSRRLVRGGHRLRPPIVVVQWQSQQQEAARAPPGQFSEAAFSHREVRAAAYTIDDVGGLHKLQPALDGAVTTASCRSKSPWLR